jgi:predicted DNA-binding protein
MIHVDISKDVEARLRAIAEGSGQSVEDHVRLAVEEYVSDLPDLALVRERRAEVAAGETVSLSEMTVRLGLDG